MVVCSRVFDRLCKWQEQELRWPVRILRGERALSEVSIALSFSFLELGGQSTHVTGIFVYDHRVAVQVWLYPQEISTLMR